ncbi:hypothetical protein NVP1084O_179 [Vibrio phage 1.084.O._10N.261.49.F5]|nr:hypothetical protein NVP1084O_179 [Vibrio phage 1.084.O._10N.261.49.F5]
MATPPSNPLVKIANNDELLPSTGLPNKQPPRELITTQGWDDNNYAAPEEFNYILNNLSQWVQYLIDQSGERELPVGSIFEIEGNSANPSTYFKYGTWESFGEGLVTVGVGSYTDDRGESKTWVNGKTEGEYSHVQTEDELATHNHDTENDSHTHTRGTMNITGQVGNTSGLGTSLINGAFEKSGSAGKGTFSNFDNVENTNFDASRSWTGNTSTNTHNHAVTETGSSSPMNNIQPSIAVYRWKRTA